MKTVTYEDRGMTFVFAMPVSNKSMILNWSGSSPSDIDTGSSRLFLADELKASWCVQGLLSTIRDKLARFRIDADAEQVLRALMPEEYTALLEEGFEALAIANLREQFVSDPRAPRASSSSVTAVTARPSTFQAMMDAKMAQMVEKKVMAQAMWGTTS